MVLCDYEALGLWQWEVDTRGQSRVVWDSAGEIDEAVLVLHSEDRGSHERYL